MTNQPRGRKYNIGPRTPERQRAEKMKGKISNNRWAWVATYIGQWIISGLPEKEHVSIYLSFAIPNAIKPVQWNLTALTHAELMAMKTIINEAINLAEPVTIALDKEAEDAFQNGDDSFLRIYRQVPQLVFRSGEKSPYGKSVPLGPDGIPEGTGYADFADGTFRRQSNVLAESDTERGGSEDDQSQADLP